MIKFIHLIFVATFLLCGCDSTAVGPDFKYPLTGTSNLWFTSARTSKTIDIKSEPHVQWWHVFDDPLLEALINEAALNNFDVQIAKTTLKKARALKQTARSGFFPDLDATGNVQRQRVAENSDGSITNSIDQTFYDFGFDASWEVDIFGGTRRAVEAATARLGSAQEYNRSVLISVLAEVAQTYSELRGIQQLQLITQKNIELQNKTLMVVKTRFDAGEANSFEVARAQSQLKTTEARLPNLTADLHAAANRLSVLTAQEPQALFGYMRKVKPLKMVSDLVPVGLRSDILRRRPDIRQAEYILAAETADIGVKTADLFPRFFLTGNIGLESLSFGDLFEHGSQAWVLGPNIKWPILRGGEIRAQIKVQKAEAEEAAFMYEKTVLTALEDAENALVRYGEELETRRRLAEAVLASEKAVRLAQTRYKAGEDNILAVIDAEQELAQTESNLVRSDINTRTHLISLFKALGGGWQVFDK